MMAISPRARLAAKIRSASRLTLACSVLSLGGPACERRTPGPAAACRCGRIRSSVWHLGCVRKRPRAGPDCRNTPTGRVHATTSKRQHALKRGFVHVGEVTTKHHRAAIHHRKIIAELAGELEILLHQHNG